MPAPEIPPETVNVLKKNVHDVLKVVSHPGDEWVTLGALVAATGSKLNKNLSLDFYENITQSCCTYRRANELVPVQAQAPQQVGQQHVYQPVQVGAQGQALYQTVAQKVPPQYVVQQPTYFIAANHPSNSSISAVNPQFYGLQQAIGRGHLPAETRITPAQSTDPVI